MSDRRWQLVVLPRVLYKPDGIPASLRNHWQHWLPKIWDYTSIRSSECRVAPSSLTPSNPFIVPLLNTYILVLRLGSNFTLSVPSTWCLFQKLRHLLRLPVNNLIDHFEDGWDNEPLRCAANNEFTHYCGAAWAHGGPPIEPPGDCWK